MFHMGLGWFQLLLVRAANTCLGCGCYPLGVATLWLPELSMCPQSCILESGGKCWEGLSSNSVSYFVVWILKQQSLDSEFQKVI